MEEVSQKKKRRFLKNLGLGGIAFIVLLLINIVVFGTFSIDKYARENASLCANCHNMDSHVESYVNGNTLDNVHAQAGIGCKDCHAEYTMVDEIKSVWNYVTGNYEKVMQKKKKDEQKKA